MKAIYGFEFLEKYHLIHEKLEIFEKSMSVKGDKYFIELIRQSMLVIYFIGWLKALVDALFPPFVIPLGIGFKSSKSRESIFLVLLVSFYLLIFFYTFILRGTIRTRVLLTPAFLLYPWIGAGIHRAMSFFRQGTWKRFIVIALICLLGMLSVYKSVDIVWKQDNVTLKAGQWLKKKQRFRKAKIITTDRRVPFYAGRTKNYIRYRAADFSLMEKFALKKRADLLIISMSKKRERPGARIGAFSQIKQFVGVKDIVIIYCSPKLCRAIGAKKL
jgi:hypothetical protein